MEAVARRRKLGIRADGFDDLLRGRGNPACLGVADGIQVDADETILRREYEAYAVAVLRRKRHFKVAPGRGVGRACQFSVHGINGQLTAPRHPLLQIAELPRDVVPELLLFQFSHC